MVVLPVDIKNQTAAGIPRAPSTSTTAETHGAVTIGKLPFNTQPL